MSNLDEKMSSMAEQIMKRPLSAEEKSEIYRISDAVGMKDVQSFLHLLLVFKLHEDTMKNIFRDIAELEKKIDETLESSVRRILLDGTERIGEEVGKDIAANASGILSSFKEFHVIRGYIVAGSLSGVMSTLAYWFGASGAFRMDGFDSPFRGILVLPAGWWMVLSFSAYAYFWFFDHRREIKRSLLYKCLFALQGMVIAILFTSLV
jgi:hypothetical protein